MMEEYLAETIAAERQREYLRGAERARMLNGLDKSRPKTSGSIAGAIKGALTRLATTIGI